MTLAKSTFHDDDLLYDRNLLAAIIKEQNIKPLESVDELASDLIFDDEAEVEEFLAWVAADRKANPA